MSPAKKVTVKLAPRFRNKAEEKSFRKWASDAHFVYSKDTDVEKMLIKRFRQLTRVWAK